MENLLAKDFRRRKCLLLDQSSKSPNHSSLLLCCGHCSWRTPRSRNMLFLCCLALILVVFQSLPSCRGEAIVFQNPSSNRELPLEHLVVDRKNTGRVYIGAVNKLYELHPDLRLKTTVTTGPKEDNPECPGNTGCSVTRQPTPSYNKALAIVPKMSKLVECDSLYQGRCRLRNLYSIDQAGKDSGSIVANDRGSSTVVFVGPGPPNPSINDVLYVASTFTGLGAFRDEVPAVASRSLEPGSLFNVAEKTINSETQISVERSQRKSYKIDYVTGFSSANFSYFVTRQPKLETGPSPYISKLVRLCHADQNYYSYTEVPLTCAKDGVDYNLVQDAYLAKPGFDLARSLGVTVEDDVLFAIFAEGDKQNPNAKRPTRKSALCVYSIREIDRTFLDNIEMCNRGEVLNGLGYFKRSKKCLSTRFPTSEITCGNEVNYPLGGQIPVDAAPVLVADAHFTAVVATTTHSYTVVFLGTADGILKKGVVESENYGFEYDEISVEQGRKILPDMDLDISGEYLFVMTPESVSKVKVHDCLGRMRCMDCLSARDPYCGWCALENKCSIKNECKDVVVNQHWLPYKDAQCTTISKVTPDKLQITSAQYIRLEVDNLPTVSGQLSCVFTVLGRSHITGASRNTDGTVECPTPQTNLLPAIPSGQHSIVATLSVQIDQGPDFASTNFTFYDCSTYTSCSMCVQSAFPCDWCVESHQCTPGAEDDCRREHIINGLNRQGATSRRGPSFCPHIYSPNPEIYVPSGSKESIVVQSINVLDFQKDFQCEFKIGHSIHKRKATKSGDEIRCAEMEFSYFGAGVDSGTESAEMAVIWQSGKALDNVQNIRVIMYKCEQLANNCGLCLTLDSSKFSCGWCSDERNCFTERQCKNAVGSGGSRPDPWLDRTNACPNPKITDFEPKSGPIAGGTEVTISGINLGRSFDDVRDAVKINNVNCILKEELYEVSTKIVCVTGSSVHNRVSSGPVVIKMKEDMKFVAISHGSFHFVDPVITGFEPREGAQAGGTDVVIKGNHMNTGSKVNGTIAGVPCIIGNRTQQELVCRTGPSTIQKGGAIVIFFDNEKEEFVKDTHFYYKTDPQVTSARPETSIVSGGLNVEIRGDNFKLLQRVKMYASYQGKQYFSPGLCDIVSAEKIICKTPNLLIPNDPRLGPTMNRPLELQYGLEMDGNVRELSQKPGFTELKVFPDPKLDVFPDGGTKYFKDEYMTINGQNLNAAASEDDVKIRIGSEWCNLTALASPALTCKPPKEKPSNLLEGSPNPEVIVIIGNRDYKVGYLSYDKDEGGFLGIPMQTIIAIVVALGVFVLAIVLLLLILRRKSTRHLRQMKSLKQQMDTIEMKVATECKEAFAELQTSISEMAQELSMGIPFLPYRDYSAAVLFPNTVNHPVLRDLEVEHQRIPMVEKGLRQFNQLLMNKTFLLTFVRTMESNKYFLSKDRVAVGSLLMVILQEKMEYCTDILKTLLADLIEKTVEKRYQPKILFRRSESVAERMLAAWFTFLMHRYLIECAGQPLFMLYWAIKQQVEKGPQDAVTLEARYSLSEEKLLRQSVEFYPLTVFVSGIENVQAGVVETPVRVLDCDTMTQVKEKCLDAIYRTTPYTHRPSANDLDLEWRTGVSGRLILQDLDMTTKSEPGGWKRMNTLAHYKVPNNASLVLMPRQASMYNLSLLSEKSDKSSTFSLKNSPTLTRALSPLAAGNHKDPETGFKIYHLTKAHEHHGEGVGQDKPKMVSEIYLTRLLTTKGTLQKFTEDLMEAIFSTAHRGSTLPLCIKYMFDFMDDQALTHGITDPEVVHAWKSNALPLRFWVNLLKNPQFVFDIPRPAKIEGCLSVVAQTLMDACSTQDHQLTKDSPSSKLLFARDILNYREWVERYYEDIRSTPAVSDQDMSAFLAEESRCHQQQGPQFNVYSALNELYQYLKQYKEQMVTALEEDEFSRRNRLPSKFQQMIMIMEGDVYANS